MKRSVHVEQLGQELIRLGAAQTRHLMQVLRISRGDELEMFDSQGNKASGVVERCDGDQMWVRVSGPMTQNQPRACRWTVAAAVPKGPRADWMIEKLSELGTRRFIPLQTEHSVVHPQGEQKLRRWERLAVQSAQQSRRDGVMTIAPMMSVSEAMVEEGVVMWVLSTRGASMSLLEAVQRPPAAVRLFIGPEGGWSQGELDAFEAAGATLARLGRNILRVETAAVAAAAILAAGD